MSKEMQTCNPMSLSNKELLDKTLFLKDSVLFISMDGKEYEVSNPMDIGFSVVIGDTMESFLDRFIKPGEKIEWPGGVELIEHYYDKNKGECGITMCYSQSENIKDKCLKWCRTVARLLPKEKKIYNQALSGYKPESDYKQFESTGPIDDSLNDNLPKFESSEPQEKSIESEKYELRRILQMQVNCLREDEMDNSDAVAIRGTTAQRIMKFLDPVSAPVESQEELLIDLLNIWVVFPADQAKERILKSFTLTRLTP